MTTEQSAESQVFEAATMYYDHRPNRMHAMQRAVDRLIAESGGSNMELGDGGSVVVAPGWTLDADGIGVRLRAGKVLLLLNGNEARRLATLLQTAADVYDEQSA